ncbi:unnamed protein product [Amoebophrya sp. A120]|nr:unnamed protein product [Amoebophrya sp. A120]|eukprot:GSA120T00016122001.1
MSSNADDYEDARDVDAGPAIPGDQNKTSQPPSLRDKLQQRWNTPNLEMEYATLEKATSNFSPLNKLGSGAFGSVYKGTLEDGNEVAIKVIEHNSDQAGFDDEVQMLSRFRHPNLVILMGFCKGPIGKERILVYELLSGGDVHQRIRWSREGIKGFSGKQRCSVALDAAQGLSHLHYSKPKAFHRDIKTPNIILDRKDTAKVGDFGLACVCEKQDELTKNVNQTAGTVGYVCPHYIRTGIVSEATEVYAFGMVLLELLTATPPAVQIREKEFKFLVNELKYDVEEVMRRLDPAAAWDYLIARQIANHALKCIDPDMEKRPKMPFLVTQLRKLDQGIVDDETAGFSSYSQSPSPYFPAPSPVRPPGNNNSLAPNYNQNHHYRQPNSPSKAYHKQTGQLLLSGMRVRARWKNLMMCNGTIQSAHTDGSCDIQYDDGDFEERVDEVEPHDEQPNPMVREMLEKEKREQVEAAAEERRKEQEKVEIRQQSKSRRNSNNKFGNNYVDQKIDATVDLHPPKSPTGGIAGIDFFANATKQMEKFTSEFSYDYAQYSEQVNSIAEYFIHGKNSQSASSASAGGEEQHDRPDDGDAGKKSPAGVEGSFPQQAQAFEPELQVDRQQSSSPEHNITPKDMMISANLPSPEGGTHQTGPDHESSQEQEENENLNVEVDSHSLEKIKYDEYYDDMVDHESSPQITPPGGDGNNSTNEKTPAINENLVDTTNATGRAEFRTVLQYPRSWQAAEPAFQQTIQNTFAASVPVSPRTVELFQQMLTNLGTGTSSSSSAPFVETDTREYVGGAGHEQELTAAGFSSGLQHESWNYRFVQCYHKTQSPFQQHFHHETDYQQPIPFFDHPPCVLYDVNSVGRLQQPSGYWDCVILDAETRHTISREHFRILQVRESPTSSGGGESSGREVKNQYQQIQCISSNGLMLNGELIKKESGPMKIQHGDILGFIAHLKQAPFLHLRFEVREKMLEIAKKPKPKVDLAVGGSVLVKEQNMKPKRNNAKGSKPASSSDNASKPAVLKATTTSSPQRNKRKSRDFASPQNPSAGTTDPENRKEQKSTTSATHQQAIPRKKSNSPPSPTPPPMQKESNAKNESAFLLTPADDTIDLPKNCVAGRWCQPNDHATQAALRREAMYLLDVNFEQIMENNSSSSAGSAVPALSSFRRQLYYVLGPDKIPQKLRIGRNYQKALWGKSSAELLPEELLEIRVEQPSSVDFVLEMNKANPNANPENCRFVARVIWPLQYNYGVELGPGEEISLTSGAHFAVEIKNLTVSMTWIPLNVRQEVAFANVVDVVHQTNQREGMASGADGANRTEDLWDSKVAGSEKLVRRDQQRSVTKSPDHAEIVVDAEQGGGSAERTKRDNGQHQDEPRLTQPTFRSPVTQNAATATSYPAALGTAVTIGGTQMGLLAGHMAFDPLLHNGTTSAGSTAAPKVEPPLESFVVENHEEHARPGSFAEPHLPDHLQVNTNDPDTTQIFDRKNAVAPMPFPQEKPAILPRPAPLPSDAADNLDDTQIFHPPTRVSHELPPMDAPLLDTNFHFQTHIPQEFSNSTVIPADSEQDLHREVDHKRSPLLDPMSSTKIRQNASSSAVYLPAPSSTSHGRGPRPDLPDQRSSPRLVNEHATTSKRQPTLMNNLDGSQNTGQQLNIPPLLQMPTLLPSSGRDFSLQFGTGAAGTTTASGSCPGAAMGSPILGSSGSSSQYRAPTVEKVSLMSEQEVNNVPTASTMFPSKDTEYYNTAATARERQHSGSKNSGLQQPQALISQPHIQVGKSKLQKMPSPTSTNPFLGAATAQQYNQAQFLTGSSSGSEQNGQEEDHGSEQLQDHVGIVERTSSKEQDSAAFANKVENNYSTSTSQSSPDKNSFAASWKVRLKKVENPRQSASNFQMPSTPAPNRLPTELSSSLRKHLQRKSEEREREEGGQNAADTTSCQPQVQHGRESFGINSGEAGPGGERVQSRGAEVVNEEQHEQKESDSFPAGCIAAPSGFFWEQTSGDLRSSPPDNPRSAFHFDNTNEQEDVVE